MKKCFLFAIFACLLGLFSHAQDLSEGEYGFKYDSITPNKVGQATNDHLFVERSVSFFSGDTQLVWFYLDDDEIYLNSNVQSLTPMPYNSNGDRYREITYNSFQCDIYLPEGVYIDIFVDEDDNDINYVQGDRLPNTAKLNWAQHGTKVIDGKKYNVFSVVCFNTSSYGAHLSSKTSRAYEQNGALKKEHKLFGLYLHNDKQNEAVSRLPQDLIIANQIFNIQESTDAGWDANQSTFFYGSGGNNESQVFMKYDRTDMYGSSGYDRNYFFLPDTVALHGKTITVPVRMQNEDDVIAFQTELQLPDGFSVVKEEEQLMVSLSDRNAEDHTIQAEDMGNGVIKITSQSPSTAAYSGNDGALFYVTLQVPANVDSTYTLKTKNTVLTGINAQSIYVNDATGTVTVYPYNMGDANINGYYTVGDVVVTASYIMGNDPASFYFMTADMDQDNEINMNDITMMKDVVLQDETPLPASVTDDAPAQMYIEEIQMTPGSSMMVNVKLDNVVDFTAFQTDIAVSEGLSISLAGQDDAFNLTDRATEGHIIESYLHEDNSIRVISYSPELTLFTGSEGPLFTFDIVAANDFAGPGTITLSRTLLSNIEGEDFRLKDTVSTVKKMLRGDVNGDGVVNVADINAVVNIILGGKASPEVMKRADVNNDGLVNISDINLLISIILA